MVTKDFEHIVRTCDIENWREALAVTLTYAKCEEFTYLCGRYSLVLTIDEPVKMSMYGEKHFKKKHLPVKLIKYNGAVEETQQTSSKGNRKLSNFEVSLC